MSINATGICELRYTNGYIRIRMFCNPGPFPFGAPKTMGTGQYIGVADHLVLTLMEDRYLVGLLGHAVDVPYTDDGVPIHWCGGASLHPYWGDFYYRIHPLFIRDPDDLMISAKGLKLIMPICRQVRIQPEIRLGDDKHGVS